MHQVFVYGTLKTDEPNHHWLTIKINGYSKYLGKATTIEKYPLIISTKYNIPFLLYTPGEGNIVEGKYQSNYPFVRRYVLFLWNSNDKTF